MIKSHLLYQLSYRSVGLGLAFLVGECKNFGSVLRSERMRILLLILALWVGPAGATSFYERPMEETVQESPVIVRVRVGRTYTDWSSSGDSGKRIYTYWEAQLLEVLKGKPSKTQGNLLIRELGGEKDGMGMHVSGTADFASGEDVVVMLGESNPDGSHDVWGMMMGKYNVVTTGDGELILTGPGLGSGEHVHGQNDPHSAPKALERWSLQRLRLVVRAQSGEPVGSAKPLLDREVRVLPSTPLPGSAPRPESTAAPALQPLETSGRESGRLSWMMGLGVILVVLLLRGRRRKP